MINSMVEFLLYTQSVGSSNLSSSTAYSIQRVAGPSGEMVDTSLSKSDAERREGSNPFLGTK